ncbi:MAG: hypothetical protein IT308_02700 [Anaerolineaceae bacterium]|nr:hypothetical protein [Anaerolineaceae bacterium]
MNQIRPLTGFLCVYPKSEDKEFMERLWKILNHPDTISNLSLIGKSYGDGAVKVEPRALERLPIPDSIIEYSGLPVQLRLFEQKEPYPTDVTKSKKIMPKQKQADKTRI